MRGLCATSSKPAEEIKLLKESRIIIVDQLLLIYLMCFQHFIDSVDDLSKAWSLVMTQVPAVVHQ